MKNSLIILIGLLSVSILPTPAICQDKKEIKKNLEITLIGYYDPNSTIFFDRKNPDKHGFEYVVDKFTNGFTSKGFIVKNKDTSTTHHYVLIMDYDYGYEIYAYKMQYKNLSGTIVDANTNKIIGTFSYKGRYENDELSTAMADRLNSIIKDAAKNKQSYDQPIVKSKEEKLVELKKMLDEGLITQEDYNTQKEKILNEQ